MNSSDLIARRLHNQRLSSSEFEKPVEVVRWLGAVQAQDFNAAKWALALRMRDATNATIEKAFNDGQILRTHLLRPTWHFVAPDDIRWLLQLTAPRVNLRCGPNYRKYGLDGPTFNRSNKVLANALNGEKHLTRAELRIILNRAGVAAGDTVRMAHILLRAELDAVVCSGPRIGKQFTYALFDERVRQTRTLDRDEALSKLTRRYFTSHGPATLQDFVWWSGLTAADARRGIALMERDLEKTLIEEKTYWTAPVMTTREVQPSAHLLPVYDEYFVAYKDRQALADKSLSNISGLLGPAVIVNGRVAGTWKNSAGIDVKITRTLKPSEKRAVDEAVDRYSAFLT